MASTTTAPTPTPNESVAGNGPTVDTQMHAVIQSRYGSADGLTLATLDRPAPAPDEVLIEVRAAAVDRGTCHLLTGTPYLIRLAGYGLTRPKNPVPGLDVAGQVIAIGAEVTRFVPGDEVFGIANGSLAEYTTAKENKLTHKPADLPFDLAAAAAGRALKRLDAGQATGKSVIVIDDQAEPTTSRPESP